MTAQAAIVAGGQGLRMRGVDDRLPKSMLRVGGKPLLQYQLEWLKASGFDEAFLCLGYKADAVSDYFGDGSRVGLRLNYQIESSPRGTAGCVRDLGDKIKGDLLVLYGDLFVDLDCRPLLDFHGKHSADATVVVRETDHPQDSDLARVEGGRITGIFRSKEKSAGNLACAALWVVRPALLELIPADQPSDFAKDIFPRALSRGRELAAYKTGQTLADIGTPERMRDFLARWEARA